MKSTRYLFCILLFGISLNLKAQSLITQDADDAYANLQYTVAAAKYKKAYTKARVPAEKERILYRMAECYRMTNDAKDAEITYGTLVRSGFDRKNSMVLLYYADALRANEKYDEAKDNYNLFIKAEPKDLRGRNGVISCEQALKWMQTPSRYEVNNEKRLNSPEDDFAPAFADPNYRSLIFTSSRRSATGKSLDDWTGQNFSDLFTASLDQKGMWSEPVLLDNTGVINTKANEGAATMNNTYNRLYFTRCETEKGRESGCQIWVSNKGEGRWTKPDPIILTKDSTLAIGHPAISSDELTIIFSCEKVGGYGGKDLWMATRRSINEPFGPAVNMGSDINTPGDEVFPTLVGDSVLYFSSNGHIGMGGLDIFRSSRVANRWTKPQNMMPPINSSGDDFAIVFADGEDRGYFSSNRKGGAGGDDIYSFSRPPLIFTLKGVVKDDRSLQFLEGAHVKLVGTNGSSYEAKTDAKGAYGFSNNQMEANVTYDLEASRDNYFAKKARETTVGVDRSRDFVINFNLEPIPDKPIILPDIIYDFDKWDLKPQYQDSLQGLIKTLEENPRLVIELSSHTDSRGGLEYNDQLSQKRAESVVSYLINRGIDPDRLKAKGYGKRVFRTLSQNLERAGFTFKAGTVLTDDFVNSLPTKDIQEAAFELNRRTEFKVLSKDFVPKPKNKPIAPMITIVTAPDQDTVKLGTDADGFFLLPMIINGLNYQVALAEGEESYLQFSREETLKLLQQGVINKNDFEGDVETVLANGSVADKAIFHLREVRIGTKIQKNITARVSQLQKVSVMLGEDLLNRFGQYTLDRKKKEMYLK
ncbi:MAG: OmpA family protein [Bacteroidota bacterium]|nr:OmpA family protein [Bacteroidota bacterium]